MVTTWGPEDVAAEAGMVTWPDWADAGLAGDEPDGYAILRSLVDLTRLPRLSRDVTESVLHATADLSYASELVCGEEALEAAVTALAGGAPVVADGPMVAAGITDWPVVCRAGEPLAVRLSRSAGISPAAAAVRLAFGEVGAGALWVVGQEPAAIYEILSRGVQPAFVVGMPAGFAGAAEAKRALRGSGIPAVTNTSEKGGAVAAAAACVALTQRARPERAAREGPRRPRQV